MTEEIKGKSSGRHTMYQTTYHRPSSVDEAAALFAKGSDRNISPAATR
jgi:hypothetical protein